MKSELLSSSIQWNHFSHNTFPVLTPRTLVINNAKPQSSIFCINKALQSKHTHTYLMAPTFFVAVFSLLSLGGVHVLLR